MPNSEFWPRISSLYGIQPSSAVFACQTASFGPELQVSMGPRPHLPFSAIKTAWFAPEYQVYIGSSPHLWFCACKTATLGPDLQVCMGPRPHLWFWAHITAYLAQELMWPDLRKSTTSRIWRSRVITAVFVPRHLGIRKNILNAIRLTLVEINSKVFVVLDKYFSQKMPCKRVAKVCMSISVFVRVY